MKWNKISVILPVIFAIGFFSVSTVLSANLDVCNSGCAYSSIDSALDAASDGDVIRVAQGSYSEKIYTNDAITVNIQGGWKSDFSSRSSDPSLTIASNSGGSVFDFNASSGITIDVTIEGITITGGEASQGAGVYAYTYTDSFSISNNTVKISLKNNIIINNKATYGGGFSAYAFTESDTNHSTLDITLTGNRITQNSAESRGGAVNISVGSNDSYNERSTVKLNIKDNEINGNKTDNFGGGMYISLNKSELDNASIIKGNDFNGNEAKSGGGVYVNLRNSIVSSLTMENNVISSNYLYDVSGDNSGGILIASNLTHPIIDMTNNTITANSSNGLYIRSSGSNGVTDDLVLNLKNNIIKDNQGDNGYEILFDNYNSDGNIVVNSTKNLLGNVTLISSPTHNESGNLTGDPKLGDDFHLKSGSQCINSADAGSAPLKDKDGNSRVGDPDIGAYEYQGSDYKAEMTVPAFMVKKEYRPVETPVVSSDPYGAKPFAVGDVDGGTLSLRITLPEFSDSVDMYAGIYISTDPDDIYQIKSDLTLPTLAAEGPVKWKSGITSEVDEALYGDIDINLFPKGKYYLYLIVAPENFQSTGFYFYNTYFVVD